MLPQTIRDFIESRELSILGYAKTTNHQGTEIESVICGGATDWLDFLKKLRGSGSALTDWIIQMPDKIPERKPGKIQTAEFEASYGYKVEFTKI